MIKVLVVDDQTLVRSGISQILDHAPDIEVVGDAADGSEAVEKALRLRPNVVLMDIRMSGMDGLEATGLITDQLSDTKVIVLTTFGVDEYVFGAVRAGASGFLLKDIEPDSLRQAVRVVAAGDALLSPSVTRRLIAEFAQTSGDLDNTPLGDLTPREREVLALVGRGKSNEEIAEELFISAATAKTHINRAMIKLGVHDRAQLVVTAFETGLIRPGQG